MNHRAGARREAIIDEVYDVQVVTATEDRRVGEAFLPGVDGAEESIQLEERRVAAGDEVLPQVGGPALLDPPHLSVEQGERRGRTQQVGAVSDDGRVDVQLVVPPSRRRLVPPRQLAQQAVAQLEMAVQQAASLKRAANNTQLSGDARAGKNRINDM